MTATHFTVTIGTVCLYLAAIVNAAPGRVGCFYDLQLCEQSELCFNDSLFGTCVTQLSDAINYSDLEPEALGEAAQVLQYLIETGYKWHDSYTQCVVGKFLQSAVTHQRYDPDVCEYLKALLDVIDQNKGGPHGAVDQLPDQAAVAPVDMAPPPPPPPSSSQIGSGSLSEVADPRSAHGEFLTQADMSSDFEQSDQESLPIEPMLSVSSNQDQNPQQEPSSFDFQQYLRAYQEALQQQQPQTRDLVSSAVEKKSDPSVPVIATTTATPVEATTSASSSFLAQLNNSAADEAENIQAMRALLALINQYVPSAGDGQATPTSRDQQEMTIGIPIPPQSQEISPEVFEQILRQQQQQQAPSENFQLSGDYPPYPVEDVYVPDFTAIPPPEILQDMLLRSARAQLQSSPRISLADLFIAEQLFGPPPQQQQQQSMIVDPRMLMDPRSRRMDPQMMQQQQQQQQFDRFDPRILMELQQQMDPRMLRQQQMDPRMLMGLQQQQQQLDPRMFMEDQQQQQVDPRMFMDPRMAMMGDPSWMMQQQQQQPMTDPRAVFSQGFGMNQNMMMSPWMQGPQGRMMDNGPFDLEMPMKRGGGDFAPFAGLNNGMSQPPYMMQQGGPDPRMMMMLDPRMQSLYAPPPYGFFPQNLAQEWRPPMALPEGFSVAFGAQGFPVIEAPLNESAEADRQFVGENEEQSANGASGPTSPNKKDQEYRSLMPSDESQDSVGEDVTVTVVKGSAEKPIPSGSDAADGSEDDYVFLITEPRLDLDQARYFLTWLAAVMNMPAQTFYDVSVSDDLMTFRVNPAVESLNATYVAQTLGGDDLRNGLRQTNNMEVLRAGVGRYTLDKSSGVDGPLMRFQQTAVVQSESAAAVEAEIAKKYDVVDPTYAFIVTEPALTYDKARRMLNWLSVKLHVPQTIFSSLLIEDHQLLFRVSPYYNQINASGVVDRLSDAGIQAELRKEFQVEIIRNGIGDRVQIVKADKRQRETLLIGLIAVACVAAILISLGIIYLVRRNIMMRKKLAGLGGDVESSKEYEASQMKTEYEVQTVEKLAAIHI